MTDIGEHSGTFGTLANLFIYQARESSLVNIQVRHWLSKLGEIRSKTPEQNRSVVRGNLNCYLIPSDKRFIKILNVITICNLSYAIYLLRFLKTDKYASLECFIHELGGVGPVENRPSTD